MKQQRRQRIRLFCVLTVLTLVVLSAGAINIKTPPPISGRNQASFQQIIPADVLARVKLLSAELNLVRQALGKPAQQQIILTVGDASPREVYFQAQALFQKANRLAYEVTGSYQQEPEVASNNLAPVHVWQLVDSALKRVMLVKKDLGIKTQVKEVAEPKNTTPTDVFNAILQANQEINILLYHRVTPSDAFEQITLAVNDTANLLKSLNIQNRIPNAPDFVANKTSSDVYKRLVKCVQILKVIAKREKIKMLSVHMNDIGLHQVTFSNVYDLSKIIVSEVRYLNTLISEKSGMPAFYPGYKTPAEVYQRAGILLKQLKLLQKASEQNPNWIEQESRV